MRAWETHGGKTMVALNFSLEREALDILKQHAPHPRAYERFLARLLFEEEAQRQERQRIATQLAAVVGDGHAA
jgi:hypothetical protein